MKSPKGSAPPILYSMRIACSFHIHFVTRGGHYNFAFNFTVRDAAAFWQLSSQARGLIGLTAKLLT